MLSCHGEYWHLNFRVFSKMVLQGFGIVEVRSINIEPGSHGSNLGECGSVCISRTTTQPLTDIDIGLGKERWVIALSSVTLVYVRTNRL
jgi:hypothetical protein